MPSTSILPYLSRNSGDLFTAEDWTQVQVLIKNDINHSVETAKAEVLSGTVATAKNALTFNGLTYASHLSDLDERYAPKQSVDGRQSCQRLFRNLTKGANDPADNTGHSEGFVTHKMGQIPMVEVYQLLPVSNGPELFLVYYGVDEADEYWANLPFKDPNIQLGDQIGVFMNEVGVELNPNNDINDLINDLAREFQNRHGYKMKFRKSEWIKTQCKNKCSIGSLQDSNYWEDLFVFFRPEKLCGELCPKITHVNRDTFHISVPQEANRDYMFLLKI